jgi:hypothetical protein
VGTSSRRDDAGARDNASASGSVTGGSNKLGDGLPSDGGESSGSSQGFKLMLQKLLPKLEEAFSRIGVSA